MIEYPKEIVKNKETQVHAVPASCVKDGFRFKLTIDFNDNSRSNDYLIAICMNPSYASKLESDNTVNLLVKHAYYTSNKYKGIIILNVLPMYNTLPDNLFAEIREGNVWKNYDYLVSQNIVNIRKYLYEMPDSDVLLAWGGWNNEILWESHYKIALELQKRKGNIFCIKKSNVKFYPPHPNRKKKNNDVFELEDGKYLIEYYVRVLSEKEK